jgi:hypothetical protein
MSDHKHTNICLSGGSDGADLLWGTMANAVGHEVIHLCFDSFHTSAPHHQVVRLSTDFLTRADDHCYAANRLLKRKFPTRSTRVMNLLRRNFFQIESAETCYAISTFDKDGNIAGGTAWAMTMFLLKHDLAACKAFLFDQDACRWHQWVGHWEAIYEPPRPSGIYAGIGARDLKVMGRLAITVLMQL